MGQSQKEVCLRHGSPFLPTSPQSKLGIALSSLDGTPINGLRHPPTETTNGWYLWCGEHFSEDTSWFSTLHVDHIAEYIPEVEPYLALGPGYRFLLSPGNVDVWYDESLLNV